MQITYANHNVEKYFTDYSKMKKKISPEWVRTIKKYIDLFEAANNFGIILALNSGRPEALSGCAQIRYSFHVTANVRLIVELNATVDTIKICEELEVKGVVDYHGGKENWYIS